MCAATQGAKKEMEEVKAQLNLKHIFEGPQEGETNLTQIPIVKANPLNI